LKVPIHNPVANIPRFIANLGLGFEVEKITIKILDEYLKKHSLNGENPNGVCGGALYLASKFKRKRIGQKRIADVVGVTDSTLRARYYDIINGINLNILRMDAN
jgi:transcription initiation factor TFIIB